MMSNTYYPEPAPSQNEIIQNYPISMFDKINSWIRIFGIVILSIVLIMIPFIIYQHKASVDATRGIIEL